MAGIGFPFRDRAGRFTPSLITPDAPCARFITWQDTATAANPSRAELLQRWDKGETEWSGEQDAPYRLVTVPDEGIILCGGFFTDPFKFDPDGDLMWTWDRPSDTTLTWDAAPDDNGGAYLLFAWNDDTRIYYVDSTGTGTLLATLTPAALGMSMVQAESLCLSRDASALIVLVVDPTDEDTTDLVGVSTSDGSVLWQKQLADSSPATLEEIWYLTVRNLPGEDAVVAGYTTKPASAGVPTVKRLNFADGDYSNAPTDAWTVTLTAAGDSLLTALTVTADSVFAGYTADTGVSHILSALATSDGSLQWRLEASNYESDFSFVQPHSIAVNGGRVLVGIGFDTVAFPTEWYGFVTLDSETGDEESDGDFPLEAFLVGPVAALASGTETEELKTFDGMPLTTWDGEPLTTWEGDLAEPCDEDDGGLIIV